MSVEVVAFIKTDHHNLQTLLEITSAKIFTNKIMSRVSSASLWLGEFGVGSIVNEHEFEKPASFLHWVNDLTFTEDHTISITCSADRFLAFKRPTTAVTEQRSVFIILRGSNVISSKRGWIEVVFCRKEAYSPRHARTASDLNTNLLIEELEVFLGCFPESELVCGAEGSPVDPSIMFMVYLPGIESCKHMIPEIKHIRDFNDLANYIDDNLPNLDYLPVANGLLVFSKKYSDGDLRALFPS